MNEDQLLALMEFVRSVAARQAAIAVDGHDSGWCLHDERAAEKALREALMLSVDSPLPGRNDEGGGP